MARVGVIEAGWSRFCDIILLQFPWYGHSDIHNFDVVVRTSVREQWVDSVFSIVFEF